MKKKKRHCRHYVTDTDFGTYCRNRFEIVRQQQEPMAGGGYRLYEHYDDLCDDCLMVCGYCGSTEIIEIHKYAPNLIKFVNGKPKGNSTISGYKCKCGMGAKMGLAIDFAHYTHVISNPNGIPYRRIDENV